MYRQLKITDMFGGEKNSLLSNVIFLEFCSLWIYKVNALIFLNKFYFFSTFNLEEVKLIIPSWHKIVMLDYVVHTKTKPKTTHF